MPRKFVIIDGSSLVHRAFYALPLLATGSGQYTNAAYGLTTMLVKLLAEVKPDAMAVAFDKGRITFRTGVYAGYKAHRKATPVELSEQFPLVYEILHAMGITTLEQEGYEADDIIGTIARLASEAGFEVIIVTGDRDVLQLVGSSVKVFLTRKGITEIEVVDSKTIFEKYGITPEQVTDLKGLMGDSSDNIPGVPGVGEKTALKLISQFGTVENILANIDSISGKKLQEALKNNAELALLSKKLATIDTNMAFELLPEEYKIRPNYDKVKDLFTKYEFKSLLGRLDTIFPDMMPSVPATPLELPPALILRDVEDVMELVQEAVKNRKVYFYSLISGRVPDARFEGAALIAGGKSGYVPLASSAWGEVLKLLAHPEVSKITYDAKAVYNTCNPLGVNLRGLEFDTLVAAYLLDPTAADYSLAALAGHYLAEAAPGKAKEEEDKAAFAFWGAKIVAELYPVLRERLEQMGLVRLYQEIEMPLIEVLAAMETAGIRIDLDSLERLSLEFAVKIDELLKNIYRIAGEEFNVNSTKQLGTILFEKLGLPVMKKTKTGYSTDAEVLEKLAGSHPIIDSLLEYRALAKLKSTYLDGMAGLVNKVTGRIHTCYNQTVTATGRLSSSEPNLQNIPIRTENGRRIRSLFIPGNDWRYLMAADYSQIELRVLAHISGDSVLNESFRRNEDIHTRTAAEVFGVSMEEVTPEMRARAKAVNFGIVYGISDFGLSRDIGVNRKEAGLYIESYFAKYPGVKAYIDGIVITAREQGYVTTMFGRRRYLPDINSRNFNQRSFAERTAMNTPVQGTAADIIKKAMVDVYRLLKEKKLRSRLLLQVHDELILEVAADEVEVVSKLVKQAMEQAVELSVPLIADVKMGTNWAEAK